MGQYHLTNDIRFLQNAIHMHEICYGGGIEFFELRWDGLILPK